MYASNLQELLFHCSEYSDLSPQAFVEYTERFNALRGYGHLPKGRDKRKQMLTPTQIALAILGLVPTQPRWAGHGATILKSLSSVGGPESGFYNTSSLVEAIALVLTDARARKSLIAARIVLGRTGTNSSGGAAFTFEHEGTKRQACFMPHKATSLAPVKDESPFDFEGYLSSRASREIRFAQSFFQRIAQAMDMAARFRGEPTGDGSEYDDEEAKQALWKKLRVTAHSRFMNVAADNQVIWPRQPTLVKFDRHHFVLMPRTKDHVQSIHLDLVGNRLDDSGAATVMHRFLSLMAWCHDAFATLGFGWSGNPVPVPVSKSDLAFVTTPDFVFDRKIPATGEARRALALYREALNAEHSELISYAVLSYYKIIELARRHRGATKKWFRDNFVYARGVEHLKRSLDDFDKLRGTVEPHEYIYKSCRLAVAHAGKDSESDPDDARELLRLHTVATIMRALARHCIEVEFKVSDCMFDGS